MKQVIGLISPGAMGASVGAAAVANGASVYWAGEGRSDASHERATRAGLINSGDIKKLVKGCEVILCICPPHDAEATARDIANLGFKGTYLEGNAISPEKTRTIEKIFDNNEVEFVDGGIIGGPAWKKESGTRLYLSGLSAEKISGLFGESPLEAIVISDQVGDASALKMVFAAYTKGSTALLTAILAVAEANGVRSDLEKQWGDVFTQQTHARVTANTAKAWRFSGEMREIAGTFAEAGVSGDFHLAAANVFEMLSQFKDAKESPDISEVIKALL